MNKLQRVSFDEQSTNTDGLYLLKDAINQIIDKMNDCEFHEKCDKCVGANIKKKKLNKCLYCGNKDDCKIDEFDSFCCKKCDKNINKKVEEMREEIANEGRCPKCVYTNNSTNCEDEKCSNYVSELFTVGDCQQN